MLARFLRIAPSPAGVVGPNGYPVKHQVPDERYASYGFEPRVHSFGPKRRKAGDWPNTKNVNHEDRKYPEQYAPPLFWPRLWNHDRMRRGHCCAGYGSAMAAPWL